MSTIRVEGQMFRANYYGDPVEDISSGFREASVQMDTENDQTWSLNAILTYAAWKKLKPYEDWLVPYLRVWYPDGRLAQGPLGRFLVLDSPESHSEVYGEVRVVAMDPLWLIARQGFTGKVIAQANTRKSDFVTRILDGAALTDKPGQGGRLFSIPRTTDVFRNAKEWPRQENRLSLANLGTQGMAHYPLYTTKHGFILTKAMGEAKLRQRQPVRYFIANPNRELLDALREADLPWGGFPSNIVGDVDTTPRSDDLINEVLMVNDDPSSGKVYVKAKVGNRKNKRRAVEQRTNTKKIKNPIVDTNATAARVAAALLDELSTRNTKIRVEVHPDPFTEYAREVVWVSARNAYGEFVCEEGSYSVHRAEYGMTPTTATMTLDLGLIEDADPEIGF